MTATRTKLHPIFFAACDLEVFRYDLSQPFIQGDHVYATDGRIMVRAPVDRFDTEAMHEFEAGERKVPKIDVAWSAIPADRMEFEIPTGIKKMVPCEDCNPDGIWKEGPLVPSSHCFECDGLYFVRNGIGVDVGPAILNSYYLGLLTEHGVTRVEIGIGSEPKTPIYFQHEEFDGVLMPMTGYGDGRDES